MRGTRKRGRRLAWLTAAVCFVLPACEPGGYFTVLGYTSKPLYSEEIHTVRVPIFKNETYYRGLEFQLTEAVIREIESKTPFKVVTAGCPADTELTGKITTVNKALINVTQLNGIRESEVTLAVGVVWRDLRAGHLGEFLSQPPPKPPSSEAINQQLPPLAEVPVIVQALTAYQPELGPSTAWALQRDVDKLALRIVQLMEKPW
jgi:hypothetical protein